MNPHAPRPGTSAGPTPAAAPMLDHVVGPADAALTLLEYGDYECPACIQAEAATRHLLQTYRTRLCFIYRHYPLVEMHLDAELAAEAAEAAAAQGQFWPMHHLLFAQKRGLHAAALDEYALALGLDMHRSRGDMVDRLYTQRVQEHRQAGDRMGLRATPAFFLNDTPVDVSFGLERLQAAVESALERHPAAIQRAR